MEKWEDNHQDDRRTLFIEKEHSGGDILRVHVKYFALCREKIGKKEEDLEGDFKTVHDLMLHLEKMYSIDTEFLMVAVNRNVVTREKLLSEGDEVAVFPPVSGG